MLEAESQATKVVNRSSRAINRPQSHPAGSPPNTRPLHHTYANTTGEMGMACNRKTDSILEGGFEVDAGSIYVLATNEGEEKHIPC